MLEAGAKGQAGRVDPAHRASVEMHLWRSVLGQIPRSICISSAAFSVVAVALLVYNCLMHACVFHAAPYSDSHQGTGRVRTGANMAHRPTELSCARM